MGRKNTNTALTLVELLIVVSIVTILALIALWYFRSQIFKGNDAKRKGDIHDIRVAIEEYEKDHNCYPLPQVIICNPGAGLQPYLNKIPCDPETHASYYYDYEDSTCPHWYRIYAKLTNTNDTDIGKLGCQNGCGPGASYNYVQGSPNAPLAAGQSPTGTAQTPAPTSTTGGGGVTVSGFYGCKGGVCVPISWDASRPGPACDPNYQNATCYNQCGQPNTECVSWK